MPQEEKGQKAAKRYVEEVHSTVNMMGETLSGHSTDLEKGHSVVSEKGEQRYGKKSNI